MKPVTETEAELMTDDLVRLLQEKAGPDAVVTARPQHDRRSTTPGSVVSGLYEAHVRIDIRWPGTLRVEEERARVEAERRAKEEADRRAQEEAELAKYHRDTSPREDA